MDIRIWGYIVICGGCLGIAPLLNGMQTSPALEKNDLVELSAELDPLQAEMEDDEYPEGLQTLEEMYYFFLVTRAERPKPAEDELFNTDLLTPENFDTLLELYTAPDPSKISLLFPHEALEIAKTVYKWAFLKNVAPKKIWPIFEPTPDQIVNIKLQRFLSLKLYRKVKKGNYQAAAYALAVGADATEVAQDNICYQINTAQPEGKDRYFQALRRLFLMGATVDAKRCIKRLCELLPNKVIVVEKSHKKTFKLLLSQMSAAELPEIRKLIAGKFKCHPEKYPTSLKDLTKKKFKRWFDPKSTAKMHALVLYASPQQLEEAAKSTRLATGKGGGQVEPSRLLSYLCLLAIRFAAKQNFFYLLCRCAQLGSAELKETEEGTELLIADKQVRKLVPGADFIEQDKWRIKEAFDPANFAKNFSQSPVPDKK